MKKSIVENFMICPVCRSPELEAVAFESGQAGEKTSEKELVNAVVSCMRCYAWYRLEDRVLEMLAPGLRDDERCAKFKMRFKEQWNGWDRVQKNGSLRLAALGVKHKLEQKEFYDEDALPYEAQMLKLPFWNAFDQDNLARIREEVPRDGVMLEIGGGTGRISLPMADHFKHVLSFDISEAMVRTAMAKRDRQGVACSHLYYFVADAENIPIRDDVSDAAIFWGILHHVESPGKVVHEMTRILKAGGRFFGNENNRSFFRPVFDLLMNIKKIWNEKAHEEHFIMSQRELATWFADAKVDARIRTSVFIPPHVFNLLSVDQARSLLRWSDCLFRALPWFKSQGGLVVFSGVKPINNQSVAKVLRDRRDYRDLAS